MIGLLIQLSAAAPQFEIESQSFLYGSLDWEQRTLASFAAEQEDWHIQLRILHSLNSKAQDLQLQGWELYTTKRYPSFSIRIGQQVIRWGQLDLLSDLNVINGMDQRFGPTIKPQWRQIPSPSLTLSFVKNSWLSSLFWLPISAQDNISWIGTPWGVLSNEHVDSFLEEAQQWPGDLLTEDWMHGMLESVQNNLSNQSSLSLPNTQSFDYGDLGVRIGTETIHYSSSFYAAWMRSRRPLARLSEELVSFMKEERLPNSLELNTINEILEDPIQITYPRQLRLGVDLSTTLSIFGLRAEACYIDSSVRSMHYMQGSTRPYISGSLALDYPFDMNLIAVETRVHHVFDPVQTPWLEANQSVLIAGIGQFSLPFAWQLLVSGQYDLALRDGFIQGSISRRLTNHWALSIRGMMLDGPKDDNPFTYSSGVMGQWREYDHLSLRIQWNP